MDREQLRRPERPLAIAAVASRLFSEKGYLETTMANIVAAGDASKGAIYHYFSSKEDILFAILDEYLDVILDGLEEELTDLPTPEARVRHIIRRHISLYATHTAESKVLLKEARNLPPEKHQLIAAKERQYYRIVCEVLREYIGPEVDPRLLTPTTFTLFGMLNWVYSWYDPDKKVPPEELSDLIFHVFAGGTAGLPRRTADPPG